MSSNIALVNSQLISQTLPVSLDVVPYADVVTKGHPVNTQNKVVGRIIIVSNSASTSAGAIMANTNQLYYASDSNATSPWNVLSPTTILTASGTFTTASTIAPN